MNTRREIVKAGVGLAAIIAAGKAPASVVKSMIGMRNSMIAGGGGWQNPYVTDGLVAMWDGEWNAGPGVHDANAIVWKDLTGSGWDFPATNMMFGANYATISANVTTDKSSSDLWNWNNASFDGVWERSVPPAGYDTNDGFFSLGRCGHSNVGNTNGNAFVWYTGAASSNWRAMYLSGNSNKYSLCYRAGVFDLNSSSKDNQKVYVNGNIVTTSNENWTTTIGHAAQSMTLQVGNYGQPKYYSLRLYNRALTAAEIAANYAVDKARFNLLDTLAF